MPTLSQLTARCAAILTLLSLAFVPVKTHAATAREIDTRARHALESLYMNNAKAHMVGSHACAVLVFPNILKGGFLLAAQRGEGALIAHHGTIGYYSSVAGSYGLQAGVQSYGYALFFMHPNALGHLHQSGGWELGSAPSLVVVDQGVSGSLSTNNLKKDIYAFFFNQKGLMGGLGLQATKITKIQPH